MEGGRWEMEDGRWKRVWCGVVRCGIIVEIVGIVRVGYLYTCSAVSMRVSKSRVTSHEVRVGIDGVRCGMRDARCEM